MTRTEQELHDLQEYTVKKIISQLYSYTTLSREDNTDRILELMLNWIACQMEKEQGGHNGK